MPLRFIRRGSKRTLYFTRARVDRLERRLLLAADVVISEFMASNSHTLIDKDGDYSDWIELHNRGDQTADLTGWFLTDTKNNLAEWQFPSTMLDPGSYLVVFASGKNLAVAGQELHTNFKLDSSGEYLALVEPDGVTVQSDYGPTYPPQSADVSYGLSQEDVPGSAAQYFTTPTPGAPNEPSAASVSFSRPGGSFAGSISISLSTATPGAQIRYTTNGSVPTSTSTLYTGSLTLSRNAQVRARAFAPGLSAGPISTEEFFDLGPSVQSFNSNIPLVVLDTFGTSLSQTVQAAVSAMVIDTSNVGRASLTDTPQFIGRAGLNIRGQSSVGFPKQQYHFEVWDESNHDRAASILGMPADSDWVLYAPYSEKSLMQNQLAYMWSNEIGQYAVRTRWCEVFLNTTNASTISYSQYVGVYLFMEKIKIDPNRVDIAKLTPDDNTEPAITGGYIWKKDKTDPSETGFTTTHGQFYLYEDPSENNLTTQQRTWLTNYLDGFENVLYGPNFKDPVNGYAKYIDVQSFIDNWILVEMAKNIDGFRLSTYYYKDRGGKIHMGPIWDYNLSMGNADYNAGNVATGFYSNGLSDSDYAYFRRLFQDPDFKQQLTDRWDQLRQGVFSTSQILADIDNNVAILSDNNGNLPTKNPTQVPNNPVVRNFERWKILGTYVWPNGYVGQSWLDDVNFLKKFMTTRVAWMDTQFLPLPTFSQPPGLLTQPFQLSISGPSSAKIYYTTDGSDPRLPGGGINPAAVAYAGPIMVSTDTRLRARVYINGGWGGIATGVWAADRGLRVGQIMYHPAPPPDGSPYSVDDFEFIELLNTGSQPIDLTGTQFTQGITFTFGSKTLAPGARTVVVKNLDAFRSRYGDGPDVAGEYHGSLSNSGEEIQLQGPVGQTIQDFTYHDGWYSQTDGGGYSLEIVNPAADVSSWNDKEQWRPSNTFGGVPAAADPGYPAKSIVISEAMIDAVDPAGNWVELHNTTALPVYVGGWFLSDSKDNPRKYQLQPGSVIAPGGYLVLYQNSTFGAAGAPGVLMPFALAAAGGSLYVSSVDSQGNVGGYRQGVDFGPAAPGVSFGRFDKSDGDADFTPMASPTPGAANSAPLAGPVILNEVMYRPVNGSQYIELHNVTASPVSLAGWKIDGDLQFTFPAGATIAAGGYALVVPIDPQLFLTDSGVPADVPVWGAYRSPDGTNLLGAEASLTLLRPFSSGGTTLYAQADHVHYNDTADWPAGADGKGASLSRRNDGYGNDPDNWGAEFLAGSPGRLNFDPTPPTASIDPVASPNPTPVNSITLRFSKPIASLVLSQLSLTRDGGPNLLGGTQTLSTTDGTVWMLGNLSSLTGGVANVTVSLNPAGVTDYNGNPLTSGASMSWLAAIPGIAGRYVFYNDSKFDNYSGAASPADDAAIAPDKHALLPGQTATFANYTSYDKGLNGIIVDLVGRPSSAPLTAADFSFKWGNDNNPSAWSDAPVPTIVTRAGGGPHGIDRVEIIWPDGRMRNKWVQVTIKADTLTGLTTPDVFYFGNVVAESGNGTDNAFVDQTDELAARNDPHNFVHPAAIDNPHDYNRDGRVDATDQLIARRFVTTVSNVVSLIAPPVSVLPATSLQQPKQKALPTARRNPLSPITTAAKAKPPKRA